MLWDDAKRMRWLGMDMRPRWRRRVAVVVTYMALVAVMSQTYRGWWGHPMIATVTLSAVVLLAGVFRGIGPLKGFGNPPDRVFVNGLDEWARYRYAAPSFDEATEAQKTELLKTYRVGTFVVPGKPYLDEREMRERDGAVRWSVQWVGLFLAAQAGGYASSHHVIGGMEVAADLWTILLLLHTLPQARVLWTERDPREITGEMELVERRV